MTQSVDIIPAVEKDARHVFTTGTSGAQRESVEGCVCVFAYINSTCRMGAKYLTISVKNFNSLHHKFGAVLCA